MPFVSGRRNASPTGEFKIDEFGIIFCLCKPLASGEFRVMSYEFRVGYTPSKLKAGIKLSPTLSPVCTKALVIPSSTA